MKLTNYRTRDNCQEPPFDAGDKSKTYTIPIQVARWVAGLAERLLNAYASLHRLFG